MNDVIVNKTTGGLGRRTPSGDAISGLLANGVAVAGGVQLGAVYRLKSVEDAVSLKITADYDTTNTALVYEHINEYFRINPNGDLRLMLVAKSVSYADMLDKANVGHAKKLLKDSEGQIKQLAVAYNPTTSVTDFTATDAAIAKAQELADDEYSRHRPVSIVLEGKGFLHTNVVDFRAKNAKNVSVMIGQSLSISNKTVSSAKPFSKYAAVGAALGAISKASVHENIGWVEKFNVLGGSLQVPAIGNTALNSISEGVIDTLHEKGSVFFKTHTARTGIYFNDSHTATIATSDFAHIENNRTIDKAVRAIRAILLPKLNSPVLVDSTTGKLSHPVIKGYESDSIRALETMLKNGEISALDVLVDPDQNILSTSKLEVKFSVTPTGTTRSIVATIGFVNPFKS